MTKEHKEILRKIIYAVETGGQIYGHQDYADFTEAYTNSDSEHAITIGAGQWYGIEAQTLLQNIYNYDTELWEELDTCNLIDDVRKNNWNTYKLPKNSEKAKCIVNIISSDVGIKCQDELLDSQMETYVEEAYNLGVIDEDAQAMCANFRHQGGYSAMKRIINKTDIPYSLDNVYSACKTDVQDTSNNNQVGDYTSRQDFVYKCLKEKFNGGEIGMATKNDAINKVIQVAKNEVGYLEKKSNSNLDDKTANAGSNNYTKYWRDVYPSYQGQPWCACFVTWVFDKVFGKDATKVLLKHYPYVYCPTLGTLFTKNANPKIGDIVIFYRNGEFTHTGIVTKVNGDYFETVEGNTSGGSTIVANGGGVFAKSYYNSNLPGTKFCTIDWEKAASYLKSNSTNTVNSNNGTSSTGTYTVKDNINPDKIYCAVRTLKETDCYLGAGTSYGKSKLFPKLPKYSLVDLMEGYADDNKGNKWYLVKAPHPTEGFVMEYIQDGTFRYLK